MKYAFVSDIHANLQAWQAVWADTRANRADMVICLGDVVGYGPRPAETLSAMYEKVNHFILGNHDAVVANLFDASAFNDDALRMIEWTRQQLGRKAIDFFRKLPYKLELDVGGFPALCVHGSAYEPHDFYYITDSFEAQRCWEAKPHDLIFVGHTHEPGVFERAPNGTIVQKPPEDFIVTEGYRYIVNAGSVGMPRTADFRACYALYDTARRMVSWKRTAYDMETFNREVNAIEELAGQSHGLLAAFDRDRARPLRGPMDFSAPSSPAEKQGAATSTGRSSTRPATVIRLGPSASPKPLAEPARRPRARRMRRPALAAVLLLLALAGGLGGWFGWRPRTRSGRAEMAPLEPPPPAAVAPPAEVPAPSPPAVEEEALVLYWGFDGDTKERVGGRAATVKGKVDYVSGVLGQAIRLTPTSRIELNGPLPGELKALTISFWLKLNRLPPQSGTLFDAGVLFQISEGHPKLYLPGTRGATGQVHPATKGLLYSFARNQNQWTHCAVVYDRATRECRYYINNAFVGRIGFESGVAVHLKPPAVLGGFDGVVDEFRLHSKALDPDALAALYESRRAFRQPTPEEERKLKARFREATAYAVAHPDDAQGIVERFTAVKTEGEGTEWGLKASTALRVQERSARAATEVRPSEEAPPAEDAPPTESKPANPDAAATP